MTEEKPWPSAQVVVAAWIAERHPEAHVGTWLPSDLQAPGALPAVQVIRRGGYDDGFTDTSRLDIYVLDQGEEATEKLAEDIRSGLGQARPIRGDGRLLDGATTEVAPHRVPYADELIVQYNSTVVATARRMMV